MVTLRPFEGGDAGALQKFYPKMTVEDARRLIDEWKNRSCNGRYFEMFAIDADGELVGEISLYHHSKSAVSIGPGVFEPFRRRGYAKAATALALKAAGERGYRLALQQVRADNAPSIALHEGMGFETDGYVYKNRRGEDILIYLRLIDKPE